MPLRFAYSDEAAADLEAIYRHVALTRRAQRIALSVSCGPVELAGFWDVPLRNLSDDIPFWRLGFCGNRKCLRRQVFVATLIYEAWLRSTEKRMEHPRARPVIRRRGLA